MNNPPKSNFRNKSRKLLTQELIGRALGLLSIWLAIGVALLDSEKYFNVTPEAKDNFNLVVVVLGVLLSLMVDQIATAYYAKGTRDDFAASHDEILTAIEWSSELQSFSHQRAFEEHILTRISSATEVKNTFIGFKSANGNAGALNPEAIRCYKRFFSDPASGSTPKVWTDIVSYNEVFGPRYDELKQVLKNHVVGPRRHIIRTVKHNIPLLNFAIFYFDSHDDGQEVVFGWLHSDISSNRRLFRSKDPDLIKLFEDFFVLLSQYRLQEDIEVNYNSHNPLANSKVADRQGWWYCVGTSKDKKEVSEAVFRISFRESGVEIDGAVNWRSRYGAQISEWEQMNHKSEKISYTYNKMFLEYKNTDGSRKGICVYNFFNVLGEARMHGYLHDDGSAERVQLAGVKLSLPSEPTFPVTSSHIEEARKQACEKIGTVSFSSTPDASMHQ